MAQVSSVVEQPLAVVAELFKAAATAGADASFGVPQQFRSLLQDPAALAQVPYLTEATVDHVPNNSLVRFRGLVHDMSNPEYYQGALQLHDGSWISTKYQDAAQLPDTNNIKDAKIWERRPIFCVPIPGHSAWAQEGTHGAVAGSGGSKSPGEGRSKRGREAGSDHEMSVDDVQGQPDQQQQQPSSDAQPQEPAPKVTRSSDVADAPAGPAAAAASPAHTHCPGDCIVYLYDQQDNVCLHDVVDIIGVVSKAPELAALHLGAPGSGGSGSEQPGQVQPQQGSDGSNGGHTPAECGLGGCEACCGGDVMMSAEDELWGLQGQGEMLATHQPTSQVLRVHAILVTRAPSLVQPVPSSSPAPAAAQQVSEARAAAVGLLAQVLGGDSLAAEYLLLTALGKVTARPAGGQPLGAPALNLIKRPAPAASAAAAQTAQAPTAAAAASTAAPTGTSASPAGDVTSAGSGWGRAVHAALSHLLPLVSYLPLSVDSCNTSSWTPRRDYDSNRLTRSPLQLASGTVLVVDETCMGAGKLSETGISSFQALYGVLQDQALSYDFQFYRQPVPVSVCPVVLSEGRSLMRDALPLSLPLHATADLASSPEQVESLVSGPELAAALPVVRTYLAAASQAEYSLSEPMSTRLQAEFVSARKADREFSPDTFHTRLTLARLLALSHGEVTLSEGRWRQVLDMEAAREARLRVGA